MAKILTGIQSTGKPHLGNLLGAIIPSITLANSNEESFFLIADLHSLTHIKDPNKLKTYTYQIASVWLACGLDCNKVALYKQSDVPEVTELGWYLNCFYSYKRLKLNHLFKEKSSYLNDVNTGIFTYPILMTADILLYNAKTIPLGRDQLQHIEISREIVKLFNRKMGDIFLLPIPILNSLYIPGIDGKKMSKSRGNIIDIFLSDIELYKQIMSIKTDSFPLKWTKNPDKDTVFYLYKLLADKKKVYEMKEKYLKGGYGYFKSKEELYHLLKNRFLIEREKFSFFIQNPSIIDDIFAKGTLKASNAAKINLCSIRNTLGFGEMTEWFKVHAWKACV